MSVIKCSVDNCVSSNEVKQKDFVSMISMPKTASPTPTMLNRGKNFDDLYFCEDHFKEIFASSELIVPDYKYHRVYSNRKKNPRNSNRGLKIFMDNGQSQSQYTLTEEDHTKDDTVVNLLFNEFQNIHPEDYEDDEPTLIVPDKNESVTSAEDNDCIITNEPTPTIIDLSDDEMQGDKDDSNKMIEVILCNDIDPDGTDATMEFVMDRSYEERNGMENEETQRPLQINFCTFKNAEEDVQLSIDLTVEENIESTNMEIADGDGTTLPTIDLMSDDSNDDAGVENFDKIIQSFCSKYPGTLTISLNEQSNQLEIEIDQNNSFNSDNEFKANLMKVVKLIQADNHFDVGTDQTLDIVTQDDLIRQTVSTPKTPVNDLKIRSYNDRHFVILKKDFTSMPKDVVKSNKQKDVCDSVTVNDSVTNNTAVVTNYNASQILKKSKAYLGISRVTFHRIENLFKSCSSNKSILMLILRKINLNETFSMLSDVLCPCPNKKDCINVYEQFLPQLSRIVQVFLRWPTNFRDTVAIVDIFEIEIEKPDSFVEQILSFCSQRQRYLVKFLVCCIPTGYITYLSMPFYSIRANTLDSCLASIPKSCTAVVANPILLNCNRKFINSRRIDTFDCNHYAEKNCIQRVFDRMRRFSLISGILERSNFELLRHTVSVVACLCNLEDK